MPTGNFVDLLAERGTPVALDTNGQMVDFRLSARRAIHDAGKLAAEMLLRQIDNPKAHPDQHLLQAELSNGSTTARAGVRP